MVVIAVSAGAAVGLVTRPAPPAEPSATPAPTRTPEPDTGPLVFKQPLTAGCATDDAVWVVSDGGGIGRFDRVLCQWQLGRPPPRPPAPPGGRAGPGARGRGLGPGGV